MQIDSLIISEVNMKQTLQNKERIKAKLALLNRNIELIVADSNDHNLIEGEQLPRGILNVFQEPIILVLDYIKLVIDKIGKYTVY